MTKTYLDMILSRFIFSLNTRFLEEEVRLYILLMLNYDRRSKVTSFEGMLILMWKLCVRGVALALHVYLSGSFTREGLVRSTFLF